MFEGEMPEDANQMATEAKAIAKEGMNYLATICM